MKPSKCFYHLISFDLDDKGRLKYANNHKRADLGILIPQPDDTLAEIEHLSVDKAHKTLGSMTCPTGSGGAAVQQMWDKAQAWLDKAIDAKLLIRNFWFFMVRQFWPQVGFGLCNNTASFQELSEALQRKYWKVVPLGGLRLTITWEICRLGIGFYGRGCPDPSIECTVEQINKLLMHYDCKMVVGILLQASLEFLIVELGLSMQPFNLDYSHYDGLVTKSWLKSIWEKV